MEFRILGPLEVVEDGNPIALGTLKERLVLGVLLLHANEFVSRERLIDDLWGEAPPPTARKAVNVYVSKLRKALGEAGADPISTASGGYRLQVEPDSVDASRAELLVARAREYVAQGALDNAAERLSEALSLWRGPTLAGLLLESRGRDEVARLDELRLAALMDRIDCDLALGRHESALGELNILVREHPLRERLRAQQMLALYRADRQAEALDAYAAARRILVDDLGIEPSDALQRLQQAILRHDPALETPAGIAAANGVAPASPALPAHSRPRRPARRWPIVRRRYLVSGGAAALAVVAALVAFLSTSGNGQKPLSSPVSEIQGDQLARINPTTEEVVWGANVGVDPAGLGLAGNALWFAPRGSTTIERLDLRRQHVTPPVPVPADPYDVAVDARGQPWVSGRKPVVVAILRARTGTGTSVVPPETKTVPVPLPAAGEEAFGGGRVWVIPGPLRNGSRVASIDVRSRRVTAIGLGRGRRTTAIAYGFGSAWIGAFDPRNSTEWLAVVRPGSRVGWIKLESGDGDGPRAIAIGDNSVWVASSAGTLFRIDPMDRHASGAISMSAKQPEFLAVGAGYVWTLNHNGYSLSKIDPGTNEVVKTMRLGSYNAHPCGIAATNNAVYVTTGEAGCG